MPKTGLYPESLYGLSLRLNMWPACLSIHVSMHMSIHMSTPTSIVYMHACTHTCLYTCQHVSLCTATCLYVCLFTCLHAWLCTRPHTGEARVVADAVAAGSMNVGTWQQACRLLELSCANSSIDITEHFSYYTATFLVDDGAAGRAGHANNRNVVL